ncbi:MAG: CDP-alcohol phosphatidyltransferase family protein [Bifidobacterium sp.]|uniref:CDP-alcohol phosphatidyltransferase family protein n=1 Tax=Bifidobacterium fermentum TaxID=3059035 RepID=A0AB39UEP0_9BIFI
MTLKDLTVESKYSPEAKDTIWTVPNAISLMRIACIPFITVLVSQRHLVLSLLLILVSALSDGVDGYIARRFNQVSKAGQILDPIADRMLIFFTILALGVSHILPWWLLIVVGLRDLLMGGLIVVLAQYDYGPLPVHFAGKTGTALLMIGIPALIVADAWAGPEFRVLHLISLAVVLWGVVFYWYAGVLYLRQGISLMREEHDHE